MSIRRAVEVLTVLPSLSCSSATHGGLESTPLRRAPIRSFNVEITDYNGSMAYGHTYALSPDRVVVTWFGDLEGEEPKTVFDATLSQDARGRVLDALQRLDLEQLQDSYVDPSVADGLQLSFQITVDQGPPKHIEVENTFQGDLYFLVCRVNGIVPEEYAIQWPAPETHRRP